MSDVKININTQGGAFITGGEFHGTEFVANKYVYTNEKANKPKFDDIEDAIEVIETSDTASSNQDDQEKEPSLVSCIETLMNEKGEKGNYLVNQCNHWIAIFRIIVDKNLGASNTDYKGFCDMIQSLKPEGFRIPLKQTNLKKISNGIFTNPFSKWKYDPAYNSTRKPYDGMVAVATRFKEILEENGF